MLRITHLLTFGCAFAVTTQSLSAQSVPRSDSARFTQEWKAVKERYPVVAMAYLRQQALNYQLAAVVLGDSDSVRRETSQLVRWNVCATFERLGIVPLPRECMAVIVPPAANIGDCFAPKPSGDAKGTYTMPDVTEAESCVQSALRRVRATR
jgi:hypothetical protein